MGFWNRIRGFFPAQNSTGVISVAAPVDPTPQERINQLEEQLMSVSSQGIMYLGGGGCGCDVCGGSGGAHSYGLRSVADVRLAFNLCSPLPSIVNQKATYFSRGQVAVWNPKSKKVKNSGPWVDLMQRPNPEQGQRQFIRTAYSYQQKYGWVLIEPEYAGGFTDVPVALYVIPNWRISFETNDGKIVRAWYTIEGKQRDIDMRRAVIIQDPAATEFDDATGLPLSRAYPLEAEVSNSIGGLSARGANIEERGGVGLISNGSRDAISTIPMQPVEKERLEKHFNRGGIGKGQRRIFVSDSNLEFQPLLFDSAKLQLLPEHLSTLQAFCDIYCFPFVLLSEGYQAKYANSSNSRRDFQDATIEPEALDWFEQLSLGLGMYDQSVEYFMDYSGVASVQASQEEKGKGQKAMAEAFNVRWLLGTVTRNDIREEMGQDRLPGEEFNQYYFETAESQASLAAAELAATPEPAPDEASSTSENTSNEEDDA